MSATAVWSATGLGSSDLVTAGFHDSQVQYWEPAKWVARLRKNQQGDAPILLHTNLGAGHGGASGRFEMTTAGSAGKSGSRMAATSDCMLDPRPEMRMAVCFFMAHVA